MQLPDPATWGAARSRAGLRPVPVTTVTTWCVPTPRRPGDPRPDRAKTEVLRLVAAATVTPRPAVLSGSLDGDARATPGTHRKRCWRTVTTAANRGLGSV